MDAHLELLGGESVPRASFAVQIDERTEPPRLAADDRDHERQAELAGAYERRRRAADAETKAEERERFDGRAAADDHLGAAS